MTYATQPLTAGTNQRQELLDIWRRCLTMGTGANPHDAVVAELSEYFHLPPQQVRHRCLHWEQESVEEWQARDRSTPEGLLDFYQTQTSWVFDTMWYHANQCDGIAPAESVEIALRISHLKPGYHLDFGAGPGSSSLFFHELGWQVALADVSTTFQDFAKWRLQRHGVQATFYDNSKEDLPHETFDLITAFDVMVHVPNIAATLAQLHRSLKMGGYLIFNIDNLPKTAITEWHLYEDQYPILGQVRRTGFRRHPKITYFHVYQKVNRSPLGAQWITLYDLLRYNRYVTAVGNQVRALKRRSV
jgi:2-polyprenyl-3-methyl-5-hydroxy-6-metoxy-1,4-benzoquinol methylase